MLNFPTYTFIAKRFNISTTSWIGDQSEKLMIAKRSYNTILKIFFWLLFKNRPVVSLIFCSCRFQAKLSWNPISERKFFIRLLFKFYKYLWNTPLLVYLLTPLNLFPYLKMYIRISISLTNKSKTTPPNSSKHCPILSLSIKKLHDLSNEASLENFFLCHPSYFLELQNQPLPHFCRTSKKLRVLVQ